MNPSSTTSNAELLRAINSLTQAVNNISRSSSSNIRNTHQSQSSQRSSVSAPGRPNRQQSGSKDFSNSSDREFEKYRRVQEGQKKSILQLTVEMSKYNKQLSNLSNLTANSQKSYKDIVNKQSDLFSAMTAYGRLSEKSQNKLIDQISKAMKSNKAMSDFKFQSGDTYGRMNEIKSLNDRLGNALTDLNDFKSKRKANAFGDLSQNDMKDVISRIQGADIQIKNTTSQKDFDDQFAGHNNRIAKHQQKIEDHSKKIKKEQALMAQDPTRGSKRLDALVKQLEVLNNRHSGLQNDRSAFINNTIGATVEDVEAFRGSLNDTTKTIARYEIAHNITEKALRKLGASSLTVAGGFGLIGKGISTYYTYMKSLMSQGLGGMSGTIALNALKMGASTQELAKFYNDFGGQVSQIGFQGVNQIANTGKQSALKLGLFGDEALQFANSMSKTLISAGFSPKKVKEFGQAQEEYTKRIQQMQYLTGDSIANLTAFDNEIISNTDTQEMMMRLSKEERSLKVKELLATKDSLQMFIGNNAEGVKFMKTLQKMNGMGVEDRMQNSVELQGLMHMMGYDQATIQKAGQLALSQPGQLSEEDRKWQAKILMDLGSKTKSIQGTGNLAQEQVMQSYMKGTNSMLQELTQEGASAKMVQDLNGQIDPNSKEAKEAAKAREPSKAVTSIMDLTNWLGNASSNPMLSSLLAIAGGVGIIAASTLIKDGPALLGKITGGLGKAGGALAAGGSKLLGGLGSLGKMGGKMLGNKLPIIGLGIAGMAAYERMANGDLLGAGGEMLSGVAGQVPGIGTAISAGIDASLMARDAVKGTSGGNLSYDQIMSGVKPIDPTRTTINTSPITNIATGAVTAQSANNTNINNQQGLTLDPSQTQQQSKDEVIQKLTKQLEDDSAKTDEIVKVLKQILESNTSSSNELLGTLKSNPGKVSFNDLMDKRSIFANR